MDDFEEMSEDFKNLLNPILYVRNVPSDCFYLILQGTVAVCSGKEGFMVKLGPFNYLGLGVLETGANFEAPPFVPDYSAKVINKARILRIKLDDYRKTLRAELKKRIVAQHQQPKAAPAMK